MNDPARYWRLPVLLALGSACGREDLNLLVMARRDDACAELTTEAECSEQAALGCSFQPNQEGCLTSDPNCAPGMCRGGDPFVRRVERSFFLNGQPFRFAGVSSWAMLQPGGCADTVDAAWVESLYDDLVPARAKVARFFAFQSSTGASGTDYTLLDAAVRGARRAGVRVQFILESSDGGCSMGMQHDAAWYTGGYQAPDGRYALSYRDFAEGVARRYRDEPTVLGYLLMHDFGHADSAALASFVTEMGQRLRGVAPNQLLSLDLDWSGSDPSSYRQLQSLPMVDFVDVDDYNSASPATALDAELLGILADFDKPAVIGEGAFMLQGEDDAALQARADAVRQRMTDWKRWGFSGALLWAYDPGWRAVSEEFDARPADPILQPGGVLAEAPW